MIVNIIYHSLSGGYYVMSFILHVETGGSHD